MHDSFPFFTLYYLSYHHSDARPTNLDVTCLRMSIWLYLLNNGYTNFSVSHIQSLNDIGPISSPKNGSHDECYDENHYYYAYLNAHYYPYLNTHG